MDHPRVIAILLMTNTLRRQQNTQVKQVPAAETERQTWHGVVRVIGAGLILAGLGDLALKAHPFRLMNPYWNLGFINSITETMPIYLLGLLLIATPFWHGSSHKFSLWRKTTGITSLVLAVFLILLVPLTITDSIRVQNIASSELLKQKQASLQQLDIAEKALDRVQTARDLAGSQLRLKDASPAGVANFKRVAKAEVVKNRQALISNTQARETQLQKSQLKKNLKNILGLVLGATCFFVLGRSLLAG